MGHYECKRCGQYLSDCICPPIAKEAVMGHSNCDKCGHDKKMCTCPNAKQRGTTTAEWDHREVLGGFKRDTPNGHVEYRVRMPNVEDMIAAEYMADPNQAIYRLAARSIGVPFEQFKLWPITDAIKPMAILAPALELLK